MTCYRAFVGIHPRASVETFGGGLCRRGVGGSESSLDRFILASVATVQCSRPRRRPAVGFRRVLLFTLTKKLMVLYTLFGCLALFMGHVQVHDGRVKLQGIYNSSSNGLFILFTSRCLLALSVSLLTKVTLVRVVLPMFRRLSGMGASSFDLCLRAFICFKFVALLTFLFSLFPVCCFEGHSLRGTLGNSSSKGKGGLFPGTDLALRLVVDVKFVFYSSMLVGRVRRLRAASVKLGQGSQNSIHVCPRASNLGRRVTGLSSVTRMCPSRGSPLFPDRSHSCESFAS